MAVILNIAAIGFGVLAFRFGPESHRAMVACGVTAFVLFACSMMLYSPAENYGVECNRFSKFAEDC